MKFCIEKFGKAIFCNYVCGIINVSHFKNEREMEYWHMGIKWGTNGPKFFHFLKQNNLCFILKAKLKDVVLMPNDVICLAEGYNLISLNKIKKQLNKDDDFRITKLLDDLKSINIIIDIDEANFYETDFISVKIHFPNSATNYNIEQISTINKINNIMERFYLNQSRISVLKAKRQIILHGPPGTGKTREALKIAIKLLKENNPKESYIEAFKKLTTDSEANAKVKEDLIAFQQIFPKEKIDKITLSEYAVKQPGKNSFTYWLNYKLAHISTLNGFPSHFKVKYIGNGDETFELYGQLENSSYEEAESILRLDLRDIIIQKEQVNINENIFSESIVLKILSSYFPDDFLPILKPKHILQFKKELNFESAETSILKLSKELNTHLKNLIIGLNPNITVIDAIRLFYTKYIHIITEEENKDFSIDIESLNESPFFKIVQFHQSYSYEDFVRGITVKTKDGQTQYITENKIFGKLCEEASKTENKDKNFVLIIDEINRAELASVFGELIYALEYRNTPVSTPYTLEEGDNTITIPENLYIIGTMNTADRSIGHIDYAIKRRFAFIEMLPQNLAKDSTFKGTFAENQFLSVCRLFVDNPEKLVQSNETPNKEIIKAATLAPDFRWEDVMIGHSYFIYSETQPIEIRLKYEIKPILKEYVKDGVLIGDNIEQAIENLVPTL